MAITASNSAKGDFTPVDPGTYVARCYSMIEIGTIQSEYMGQKKTAKKVAITWELPTELAVFHEENGPEPYVVSKTYTLSMYEKASLRKDLESWRGKGFTEAEAENFDITKLLGQPCLLTVVHQPGKKDPNKTYTAISAISKLMKGQTCPESINKSRILSYDDFDWKIFDGLSDYMKEKIKSSEEYKRMVEPQAITHENGADDSTDGLPF